MVPGKKHSSSKAAKCFEGRYCGDDSCSRLDSVREDGEQKEPGVCLSVYCTAYLLPAYLHKVCPAYCNIHFTPHVFILPQAVRCPCHQHDS